MIHLSIEIKQLAIHTEWIWFWTFEFSWTKIPLKISFRKFMYCDHHIIRLIEVVIAGALKRKSFSESLNFGGDHVGVQANRPPDPLVHSWQVLDRVIKGENHSPTASFAGSRWGSLPGDHGASPWPNPGLSKQEDHIRSLGDTHPTFGPGQYRSSSSPFLEINLNLKVMNLTLFPLNRSWWWSPGSIMSMTFVELLCGNSTLLSLSQSSKAIQRFWIYRSTKGEFY